MSNKYTSSINSENTESKRTFTPAPREHNTSVESNTRKSIISENFKKRLRELYNGDDWLSNWIGILFFLISFIPIFWGRVPFPSSWNWKKPELAFPINVIIGYAITLIVVIICLILVIYIQKKEKISTFLPGFLLLLAVSVFAQFLGENKVFSKYGLRYAVWSLFIGLLISNLYTLVSESDTPPRWLLAGEKGSFYIKIGLVLLGTQDIRNILRLGGPGLFVSWIPTPLLVILGYLIAIYVFRMSNQRGLAMMLVVGTCVCGESAAMAICSCINGAKPDLTLTIALIALFTIPQMIGIPFFCRSVNMDEMTAGAWIGGTIDATPAVVAASEIIGGKAYLVGPIVKITQNAIIGFIAIAVSIYWTIAVENSNENQTLLNEEGNQKKKKFKWPSLMLIYDRFPKFLFGYFLLAIIYSFLVTPLNKEIAAYIVKYIDGVSKLFFTMGFVAIGFETSFSSLFKQLKGGKAILLYLVVQALDLGVTYLFAWLAFGGILWPQPEI